MVMCVAVVWPENNCTREGQQQLQQADLIVSLAQLLANVLSSIRPDVLGVSFKYIGWTAHLYNIRSWQTTIHVKNHKYTCAYDCMPACAHRRAFSSQMSITGRCSHKVRTYKYLQNVFKQNNGQLGTKVRVRLYNVGLRLELVCTRKVLEPARSGRVLCGFLFFFSF
jgi:hypothetical protein